ncbi:hypothetical protein C8R44DRAFT_905049, partial [Mycena epipterygia]
YPFSVYFGLQPPSHAMAHTRPATISELESFAQADPDTVGPGLDLQYYLRRAEEHQRAGKELTSGAGKGSTATNPRGSWDAGTDMEQAFVEYARARNLILETIPAHHDYATILQREQRADLTAVSRVSWDRRHAILEFNSSTP